MVSESFSNGSIIIIKPLIYYIYIYIINNIYIVIVLILILIFFFNYLFDKLILMLQNLLPFVMNNNLLYHLIQEYELTKLTVLNKIFIYTLYYVIYVFLYIILSKNIFI